MPGSTPNRHYPYPLGTDTIYPPRDIRALAEAVDADFSAQVTTADLTAALAGYLRLTGGAVTGAVSIDQSGSGAPMSLRNGSNAPYVEGRSHDAATRYGFIQFSLPQVVYNIDSAAGFHFFRVANVEKFRVSPTGGILSGNLTITGTAAVTGALSTASNLTVTGDVAANDVNATGNGTFTGDLTANDAVLSGSVTASGTSRANNRAYFGGDGAQLNLIDTVVGAAGTNYDVYINFYGQGTITAPGTRAGYIGYAGATTLHLFNEAAGGNIDLNTTGAGDIRIAPGAGGQLQLYADGSFQGAIIGSDFIWGKSAADLANAGIEMLGAGSSAEGSIRSTMATNAFANIYCRHQGATTGTGTGVFNGGESFADFCLNTSTPIGSITQVGTTGVNYGESSDYRLKNDLGPVVDALARLMELRPRHLSWKVDDSEFDGFLAHEVAAVVPTAVAGAKDAVNADGDIAPQQLDQSKLVALLVAAVQELATTVAARSGA